LEVAITGYSIKVMWSEDCGVGGDEAIFVVLRMDMLIVAWEHGSVSFDSEVM
jgi:hypothetical protein